MKIFRLITVISILIVIVACGKKGPVRALDAKLPGPVQNVELRQRGEELVLSWQLPTRNQNNTPLESAPEVDIYRMLFDPNDDCPECTDRSAPLYTINPELPRPASLSGATYILRDRQVATDQGYQYRLVPRNRRGQDGQPLIVRIVYIEPPAAPVGLIVEAHDRSAFLSWPPLQPVEGMELAGYRIYRGQKGSSQPPVLLKQLPPSAQEYDDLTLENGKLYTYQIRALFQSGEQLLESLPSDTLSAEPMQGK